MFEVPYGQDPYSAIGKYIRDHITAIEDIIAVIDIDGVEINELFMVDMQEDGYFVWESDWWEGEENITLIDFFPVSEAQRANQNVQSADTISRQDAIDEIRKCRFVVDAIEKIRALPSAQLEPLTEEEMRLLKKLRSFHNGSYAKLLDKLVASAQPEVRTQMSSADTISRQAAIDALKSNYLMEVTEQGRIYNQAVKNDIKRIEGLPPAQPELQWIPCSEPPQKDGTYIVYAPDYMGGSSSAKECHNGVMFSKYKNGKWSIEHGYYSRPNCVKAWRELPVPWEGGQE